MHVYRVETVAGRGPYVGRMGNTQLDKMGFEHWDEEHPSPYADLVEGTDPDDDNVIGLEEAIEVCGFATKEQMRAWFKGWRSVLAKNKMTVAVYEVDAQHVRVGVKQAVFQRDMAKLLRRGTISAMMG